VCAGISGAMPGQGGEPRERLQQERELSEQTKKNTQARNATVRFTTSSFANWEHFMTERRRGRKIVGGPGRDPKKSKGGGLERATKWEHAKEGEGECWSEKKKDANPFFVGSKSAPHRIKTRTRKRLSAKL